LQKLLRESASGKAMFHVCHGSYSDTLPALIKKYDAALASALKRVAELGEAPDASGWLELYVLVLYDRNAGGQPYLHRYAPPPLGDGFTPAFHPDPIGKVPIPRP
jgi:hypothetical protein